MELKKGDQSFLDLSGAPHSDFLDCECLLLLSVTLHLRCQVFPNNYAFERVGTWSAADITRVDQTPHSSVIEKGSLFVNKVVFSDCQSQYRKSF